MVKEPDEIKIQIHLSEFTALRDEMLALMKWKDSLVFISLTISGAIFTFVFNKETTTYTETLTPDTALYIVPVISSIMFGLWVLNTLRVARIGYYIKDVLAFDLNNLLNLSRAEDNHEKQISVLGWEGSKHRLKFKMIRQLIEIFTYLVTFALSGVLAQILLLNRVPGKGYEKLFHLKYPQLFLFNSFILYLTCIVFIFFILKGIVHDKSFRPAEVSSS